MFNRITNRQIVFILTCEDDYLLQEVRMRLSRLIQEGGGTIPSEDRSQGRLLGNLLILETKRWWWQRGFSEEIQDLIDKAEVAAQARRNDEAEEVELELPPRDGEPTLRRGR